MHRKEILDLLNLYDSKYSEELVYKEQIINFINHHDNCFDRSCRVGHLTASAFLLNKEQDKSLLMHHKKLNIWVQLGGHCDGEMDVLAVAIKEAQEESGIKNIVPVSKDIFDLDVHLIPENKKDGSHYHYDIRFLLKVNSDEELEKNDESNDLKWVGFDECKNYTQEKSITRLFDKYNSLRNNSV